ncbi:MAG: DUF1697 domain-containing protein [Acidobacteriota bacterium]|nr:DUF1697 domain-containing protein [Acidobacteriota bacterium]
MPTHIALLRAVNVGGHGKLTMADFRSLLANLGYTNVETYIQSGNAVFDAKPSAAAVHIALTAALTAHMGAPVDAILRTHADLTRIIDANPFAKEAEESGARVHVGFLAGKAKPNAAGELDRLVASYPTRHDSFHLNADALYLHLPDGAADTKFTPRAVERALGVPSTGRNWNTVLKLYAMSAR